MYICKSCGNKKHFTETNVYKTALTIDEKTHKVLTSYDEFDYMERVECDECGELSEDGLIIFVENGKVVSCE